MQKFKQGDKVRIVGYGHKHMITKLEYPIQYEGLSKIMYETELQLMYGKDVDLKNHPNSTVPYPPKNLLHETNDVYIIDTSSEVVGQEGTIEGSYHDLYGKESNDLEEITQNKKKYSLKGVKGKCAWYNEEQLELIN